MTTSLKLAITTIGDLLLDKKITQDNDGNNIKDINLAIPNYQRPYKWTAKNAIQLLDDIIDAKNENKETYRVGTLILHYDEKKSTYNIVDGQQRAITFSLLLKALVDAIKRDNDLEKLHADSISFLEQPLADNPHNARNIPNNFRALQRRANNIVDDRDRRDLLDYIKKTVNSLLSLQKIYQKLSSFLIHKMLVAKSFTLMTC